MKKGIYILTALALTFSIFAGCSSSQSTAKSTTVNKSTAAPTTKSTEEKKTFEMKKEVEFVVPASAGGGSDIMARVMADIVLKKSFAPKSLMVVNKPGGACAVGYNYLGTKKSDPYTLLSLHSGPPYTSYAANWPQKYDESTDVIAIMAYDDILLCTSANGKYKDLKSLLEAAKKEPNTIKFGSTQRLNSDHLGYEIVQKYTGAKFNYVQYDSAGDSTAALLGGHVDVVSVNPAECYGQVEAKKFVPIATFADKRLDGIFKDTPTFGELGYKDIKLREWRGISGTKDMPADAFNYYLDLAKKVYDTPEWQKDYLQKYNLTPVFMGGKEAQEFAKKDVEMAISIFKETGAIK
ncbi:MAG: transporter [Clostridiales bacterium]|jgi:putative tricarboxylic transport membrane protein|nr:transporter [Clostridiales bacterium]